MAGVMAVTQRWSRLVLAMVLAMVLVASVVHVPATAQGQGVDPQPGVDGDGAVDPNGSVDSNGAVDPTGADGPTPDGDADAPTDADDAQPDRGVTAQSAVPQSVELTLTKSVAPASVQPGEAVEYQLVASCSSLEQDCVGFTITDVLPDELEVSFLPTSNSRREVSFDPVTRELRVVYLIDLGNGEIGVPAGSSQAVAVGMRLPAQTPVPDATVITNVAEVVADGVPAVSDSAEVTAVIPVRLQPVATKTWQPSSAIAGSGAGSSITVGVRSASTSSTQVTDVAIADITEATFDRFDLTTVGTLDRFPDGADQVVVEVCTLAIGQACGDADWLATDPQTGGVPLVLTGPPGVDLAGVTAVRYRFANAGGGLLPFDPTAARVTFDVVLRDTLRSSGEPINPTSNERVSNCAVASADAVDPVAQAISPVACATFTILPGSVVVGADKVMFADNNGDFRADGAIVVGQNSGVTMKILGRNDSAFSVPFLRITEPAASTVTTFDNIDVEKLRVTFPAGATAAVLDVTCRSGPNPGPQTLTPPPTVAEPPVGCDGGGPPASVTVTFTGDDNGTPLIGPGATAGLDLFGRASGVTMADVGPTGLTNCASVQASSAPDGTGASTAGDCAVTPVQAPAPAVGNGSKSTRGVTTITPGQELDFTLSFRNTGNIAVSNVVLVDPVDPLAPGNPFDVVRLTDLRSLSASPARVIEVFDPDAGGGGGAYVAYNPADAASAERARGIRVTVTGNLAVDQVYRIGYSVLLRDGQPVGLDATPFRNCAAVGLSVASSSPFCSPFIRAELGGFGASLNKAIAPSQLLRPQPGLADQVATVRHQLANTGTSYLSQLSFTDVDPDFFDAVEFVGNVRVNFPVGANRVRVDVCTSAIACAADTFIQGTPTARTSPSLPAGVTPAQVKGVRVTFTNANGGFEILPVPNFPSRGLCPNATVCFAVKVLAYDKPGPDDPASREVVNTSTGEGRSALQPVGETFAIGPAAATLTVTEGVPSLGLAKGPDSNVGPGDVAPINLVVTNTGTNAVANPVVVDPLPDDLTFVEVMPGAAANEPYLITYTLPAGYLPPPSVEFVAVRGDPGQPPVPGCVDPNRVCRLAWSFPGWDLPPGGSITVQIGVALTPGVLAGDVITNTAGAAGDNDDLTCSTATSVTGDLAFGPGTFCTDAAVITTLAGDDFTDSKWVAADPALGWLTSAGERVPVGSPQCPSYAYGGVVYTRFPCQARVLPGQTIDYLVVGVNSGTNPLSQLVIVDGLPVQGDTGVLLANQARGTQWNNRPILASPVVNVEGYPGVTTGYATATFPGSGFCTANLNPPGNDTCPPEAFAAGPGPDATGFRTVVDFATDALLPPGGSVTLSWTMQAPATLATSLADPVAWNSFAYRPSFIEGDNTTRVLPATEPVKVGVAMPMGTFAVTKQVVGLPAGVPLDDFEFSYRCTVAMADGLVAPTAEGTFTIGDGDTFTSPRIPAASTCRVWETNTQGGVSNLDGEANAAVVDIVADEPAPTVEAVNTYDSGSLTIAKLVQWDDVPPVELPGDFVVEVVCAFPTVDDILPGYPLSVNLADGDATTITDLPAGAGCGVTETVTQGSMVTTMEPSNADAVEATTVVVIVDADDDADDDADGTTLTVRNTYTTGAIRLTKVLTGDASR